MGATAGVKLGFGAVKALLSPVGICIVSVICIILMGFNPLFLVFDLIVKSINVISGNALIQQVINNTFNPQYAVFIIYITVFITSFLLLMIKLIKNGIHDLGSSKFEIATSKEKVNTFSGTKLKWIIIWLVGWICLPFAFGIIMFVINIFANMFALNSLTINTLFKYTPEQFDTAITQIRNALTATSNSINDIIITYFPKDIDSVSVVPIELEKVGINLEQYKAILNEFKTNADAQTFLATINNFKNKIDAISQLKIFTYDKSSIMNVSKIEMAPLVNELSTKINALLEDVAPNNFHYGDLEIVLSNLATKNNWDANVKSGLYNIVSNFRTTIEKAPANLILTFKNTDLLNLGQYGIDGQKSNVNDIGYLPEPLTCKIASALYQQNVINWTMTISSSSSVSKIPIIGQFITVINNIGSVLSDPISIIDILIPTFAFAFCFTTFWAILIMFASKFFDFMSMLLIGPFASITGISDNGEKFQVWFKTFFSKALIVFIISLSLALFAAALDIFAEFISIENLKQYATNVNSYFINIFCKFLLMILTIATSTAMLEFINWSAQTLSFDLKLTKYQNNWTRKKMNFTNNMEQAHNNIMHNGGYRAGGGKSSSSTSNDAPKLNIPKQ